MRLNPDQLTIAKAILSSEETDFVKLTRMARLQPEVDFRYACLRGVSFGAVDLAGYDFTGADLTNADLSETCPPGPVLDQAITVGTKLPNNYSRVLARQA